jgi:AcrR family transcriptional regulator
MAAAVAEQGYAETTVADVLRRASMSRRTFYGLFSNREECFLAAYDLAEEQVMQRLGAPTREADLERRFADALAWLAEHPQLAWLFLIEPLALGRRGLERHEQTMRGLARLLARCRAANPRHPGLPFDAGVGAVHRVVSARVVAGHAGELPRMAGQLARVIDELAPAIK